MQVEEIHHTKSTLLKQCNASGSFILQIEEVEIGFKLCELVSFRKKVLDIDLLTLLDAETPDVEVIHLPHCNRFLVLDIHQVLQFRELLNDSFNILALNSAVQKILRRHIFNF